MPLDTPMKAMAAQARALNVTTRAGHCSPSASSARKSTEASIANADTGTVG